jgi:hypothetical protein
MLVHPGAPLRQKLQDRKHLPSLEISKETPFVAFFRIDDVLLKVRNRKARCYTLSLCATTSHIPFVAFFRIDDVLLKVRNRKARCYTLSLCATTTHILALCLVLLKDMMIESLSLWFQIPV